MMAANQLQQPPKKSVTGFVTKLVGDGATYGFINDEIFFSQAIVAAGPASVNDRVFAECEYSAHLPIKWNATSVKIISKGSSNQPQAAGILESDPRKQSRQSLLDQTQTSFNQSPNVAVTYQQHRQQRLQRQNDSNPLDSPASSINNKLDQQPMRLLDQGGSTISASGASAGASAGEQFYGSLNQPPPAPAPFTTQPSQILQPDLQPFQIDTPMGPPKLTYTSQLGSAFVQSPMGPAPFLSQPPPALLPQQQPTPSHHQQHMIQMNNQPNNQHRQQNNHLNKNRSFNNQNNDKNDNRQGNRRYRNDGKFDNQSRDRDNSHNNNRSSRRDGSRDRSHGRGTSGSKRDENNVRPSPPSHNRSTSNVSFERSNKSRKHYEVQNIPKSRIMTNLNAWNMRQRCSSSVHVPSDLKDIIVNQHFRLDIKNTPKPLKFKIEEAKPVSKQDPEDPQSDQKEKSTGADPDVQPEKNDEVQQTDEQRDSTQADESSLKGVEDKKEEKIDQITPPSSKSDTRLNHKYGVKVVLFSLPELDSIYKNVFGQNLDSYASDSRSHPRLDESVNLLCHKSPNGAHSMIGGKFDSALDGFIEGEANEFERHGRQPDLIATCRRVVLEQTGLDLGPCKSWTLISTFIYNNRSDYFSSKASIEYSFIYMPHIWTMTNDILNDDVGKQESMKIDSSEISHEVKSECEHMEVQESEVAESGVNCAPVDQEEDHQNAQPQSEATQSSLLLENLADLKVLDLKAELDKREIKYKPNAKKAELVALLQGVLSAAEGDSAQAKEPASTDEALEEESEVGEATAVEGHQLEEGEVEAGTTPDEDPSSSDGQTAAIQSDSIEELTGKRKADDEADDSDGSKKVCSEESRGLKDRRVELIKEPFVVRARDGQLQLTEVSLYNATQASRYDQFELSVASTIIKESLVQHLSEYIFTTLVEDNRQRNAASQACDSGASSQSSQETNSDTNNNTKSVEEKADTKEYPVNRYINLAVAYFDSAHMGYIHADDLSKLFNNTGLTISKRALISLIGDLEKFNYRTLPDLPHKLAPINIYKFPEQFNRLPGEASQSTESDLASSASRTIEYQGVRYDIEKLIQQAKEAETMQVNLVDRFNHAIENFDKQTNEIHVLEVNQKSLSKAIKTQNDEICDLKREREVIKKKYDNLRKGIKGTISSLSELVKEDK